MFYDQFEKLCQKTGDKPYSLAIQLGAKRNSIVDQWKKGSVPRQPMLQKIADHFGVSIDYLLTGEEKSPDASAPRLSETALRIAEIADRLPPEHRRLLLAQVQALERAFPDPASAPGSPKSK